MKNYKILENCLSFNFSAEKLKWNHWPLPSILNRGLAFLSKICAVSGQDNTVLLAFNCCFSLKAATHWSCCMYSTFTFQMKSLMSCVIVIKLRIRLFSHIDATVPHTSPASSCSWIMEVQWGMLQRTMLQRTMLQRTSATTNECYNERVLQRTNATTNNFDQ